ncbi:MAG: response regulator [Sphingobacteriales bacterium]|jgi:CheY-like chemotaxis protein|nr:response regulator [Sphingobacteriales bacterium]
MNNKKILLIEDNSDVRENTAEILELANYNVVTAPDGKEGVEIARHEKPDLIICDIMMPGLDGYGVLHLISKDSALAMVPFIFLTAKAERSDMRKGMDLGADDYITKPFDKTELLNAVESRIRKSDLLHKEYGKDIEGLGTFISDVAGGTALKRFLEGKRVNHYRKKESIYLEGNYPSGMYYVTSGKIKIFKTHEYGKELITDLLKEGDFFGYTALLEENPYNESAEALEDSEVTFIPKEEFQGLLFGNPAVTKNFLKILTKGVLDKQELLLKLAYSSVRKRTAEALILLQDKYKQDDDAHFEMAIAREDLANIVGTATESLIRTLSDFKEEKLVEIRDGKIRVLDADKLRKLKA